MIYVTFAQLREHVNMKKFNADLIGEVFSALAGHGKQHYLFTNTEDYLVKCPEYANEQGWDLETTLVLYDPPPTDEERAEMAANTAKQIAEDPDWDDIQIGHVDPKQIICQMYQNLTFKKLIQTFNTYANLKAFL